MKIEVEVVDLSINNLASLCRGFREAADIELRTIASADESRGAQLMVVPGVGAYGAAIGELRSRGLDRVVGDHVEAGSPLLGVCLGMQLLSGSSEESPGVPGLGFIPGAVRRLVPTGNARVPNVGWGGLEARERAEAFPTLTGTLDFYFVHSYAFVPDDDADVLVTSSFGGGQFVAGVWRDNVLGLQFHPEKSSRGGIRVLADVVAWAHG